MATDLIADGLRAYERGLGSKKPKEQATAELCEPGRARAIASGARGLCGPGKPPKTCYRTSASGRRPWQVAAAAAPRVQQSRSAALIRLFALSMSGVAGWRVHGKTPEDAATEGVLGLKAP